MKIKKVPPITPRGGRQVGISPPEKVARKLAHALRNPLRAAILEHISKEPLSATKLAKMLKEPLSKVSYHLNVLHTSCQLTKVTAEREVRGSVEIEYAAKPAEYFLSVIHAEVPDDLLRLWFKEFRSQGYEHAGTEGP